MLIKTDKYSIWDVSSYDFAIFNFIRVFQHGYFNLRPLKAPQNTMKAIIYDKYGSPDVLRIEDIEKPIPEDNEVLVKIYAVSINAWDWDMLTGKPIEYRLFSGLFTPRSTRLHGCDIAGKVEEVGKNVKHFHVGDEVFGDLSEGGWGAFAQYICAPAGNLMGKPSGRKSGCHTRKAVNHFLLHHHRRVKIWKSEKHKTVTPMQ